MYKSTAHPNVNIFLFYVYNTSMTSCSAFHKCNAEHTWKHNVLSLFLDFLKTEMGLNALPFVYILTNELREKQNSLQYKFN